MLERLPLHAQIELMQRTDVLLGVHGAAFTNAMFLPEGAVVIDMLPSNMVEYAWHNLALSAGVHYFFVPYSSRANLGDHDADARARRCAPHPVACAQGTPYDAGSMTCLGIRNCDLVADPGAVELVLRQVVRMVLVCSLSVTPFVVSAECAIVYRCIGTNGCVQLS